MDRPAYRELHAYMAAHGWPSVGVTVRGLERDERVGPIQQRQRGGATPALAVKDQLSEPSVPVTSSSAGRAFINSRGRVRQAQPVADFVRQGQANELTDANVAQGRVGPGGDMKPKGRSPGPREVRDRPQSRTFPV